MSFTTIDIDPAHTTVQVVIKRPDGSPINSAPNTPLSGWGFGISGTTAYFNSNGATPGQEASLGYDGSRDSLFLLTGSVPDMHLLGVEAPQAQMAAARRAGQRSSTPPAAEPPSEIQDADLWLARRRAQGRPVN